MFRNSIGFRRLIGLAVFVPALFGTSAMAAINWQPAGGLGAVENFQTAANWSASIPAHESVPPGAVGTWFIEGSGGETPRPGFNGTIILDVPRDGTPGNPKLGAGAIGGGQTNEVTTLLVSSNVTITGDEVDAAGNIVSQVRQFRLGQQDWTDDDVFPWGIVKQTSGHFNIEMSRDTLRGDLLMSNDKSVSAGAIWEVGGNASLQIATDVHMGEKVGVKSPGVVFRVRGSDVGPITVGDRFMVRSHTATWDVSEVDLGAGYRHQFNRGKAVVEFVLDGNGVSPITVLDNLDIGSLATVNTPNLGEATAIQPGFLRLKLSEPTTAGSGTYNPSDPGAGDVIVLFESDRITSAITSAPAGAEELIQGRFFGPDHTNDAGTSPHRALLDGFRVLADYAGAQYSWQINYFESGTGTQDMNVTPAVILSGLQITGTPGDLNGDMLVSDLDRNALMAAIASPPVSSYDLLGAAQHLYDLNADGVIDNLDLVAFNTHFLAPVGLAGDYNGDGFVDAADYTVWRNNLGGDPSAFEAGSRDPGNISPTINGDDYTFWKNNYGMGGPGAGGLAGLSGSVVPEPSSVLLALLAVAGVFGMGRRSRVTA